MARSRASSGSSPPAWRGPDPWSSSSATFCNAALRPLLIHLLLAFPDRAARHPRDAVGGRWATSRHDRCSGGRPPVLRLAARRLPGQPAAGRSTTHAWPSAAVVLSAPGHRCVLVCAALILVRRWREAARPAARAGAGLRRGGDARRCSCSLRSSADVSRCPTASRAAVTRRPREPSCWSRSSSWAALLRSCVSRGAVPVGADGPPGRDARPAASLRDALAERARRSHPELAYWLPERGRYVDATGQPTSSCPTRLAARGARSSSDDGEPVAAIVHDASLDRGRGAGRRRRRRRGAGAGERAAGRRAAGEARGAARVARAPASRRHSRSAAGWSATCTTARSSGWCRWR